MKLDEIDKRILKALQEQGRISNADLADSINLSQSACYRRVQRLEDDGIVKEYATIALPVLGTTRVTVPFLPLSFPARTMTSSPFLSLAAIITPPVQVILFS